MIVGDRSRTHVVGCCQGTQVDGGHKGEEVTQKIILIDLNYSGSFDGVVEAADDALHIVGSYGRSWRNDRKNVKFFAAGFKLCVSYTDHSQDVEVSDEMFPGLCGRGSVHFHEGFKSGRFGTIIGVVILKGHLGD